MNAFLTTVAGGGAVRNVRTCLRRRRRAVVQCSQIVGGSREVPNGMREAFGSLSEETRASAIVEALCKEGKVEEAVQAVQELRNAGVQLTVKALAVRDRYRMNFTGHLSGIEELYLKHWFCTPSARPGRSRCCSYLQQRKERRPDDGDDCSLFAEVCQSFRRLRPGFHQGGGVAGPGWGL